MDSGQEQVITLVAVGAVTGKGVGVMFYKLNETKFVLI